jgi:hypothetical protein
VKIAEGGFYLYVGLFLSCAFDRITTALEHHLNSADLIWIIRFYRIPGCGGLVHISTGNCEPAAF